LPEGDNNTRTAKCENGAYTILHKTTELYLLYYDGVYSDAIVEVDGRFVAGTGPVAYGVVLRVSSDGKNMYGVGVSRDGKVTGFRYLNDRYSILLPPLSSAAIKTGAATNRLKVVAQGERLTVYVNEQFVISITDASFANGRVGLFIDNDEPNGQVAFSNLRVSTIGGTPGTPTTPIATPTR
jgi:hypothetical protein